MPGPADYGREKEQTVFLRTSIESEGLRKLAAEIKPEQLNILREIIEENNNIEFIELDQKFHSQLLKFSNQNVMAQILQKLYSLTRLIGHQVLMKTGRM